MTLDRLVASAEAKGLLRQLLDRDRRGPGRRLLGRRRRRPRGRPARSRAPARRPREASRGQIRPRGAPPAPTVYVTFEPPLAPEYGPELVSAVTTRTWSGERPKASAAITAKPEFTPLMSAAAVTTVIDPSAFTRQTAAAGSLPPGQYPSASPIPSSSGSEPRSAQSGCSRIRSSTSTAPIVGIGLPLTLRSPSTIAFFRRISTGSRPSFVASSSSSDSRANAAVGAPGAR